MPPDRHPDHHSHDDTHGGSIINADDIFSSGTNALADHHHPDYIDRHVTQRDEPADVTVSDLLDAYYTNWHDVAKRATPEVIRSADRVYDACRDRESLAQRVAEFTPEERAEFDRRTT